MCKLMDNHNFDVVYTSESFKRITLFYEILHQKNSFYLILASYIYKLRNITVLFLLNNAISISG